MGRPSAHRVKRHRQRQKADQTYAEVDLPNSFTSHLIACGLLSEPDSFEPKKIGEAFMALVMRNKKTLLDM